jgi:hypothetical protein
MYLIILCEILRFAQDDVFARGLTTGNVRASGLTI